MIEYDDDIVHCGNCGMPVDVEDQLDKDFDGLCPDCEAAPENASDESLAAQLRELDDDELAAYARGNPWDAAAVSLGEALRADKALAETLIVFSTNLRDPIGSHLTELFKQLTKEA